MYGTARTNRTVNEGVPRVQHEQAPRGLLLLPQVQGEPAEPVQGVPAKQASRAAVQPEAEAAVRASCGPGERVPLRSREDVEVEQDGVGR